MKQPIIVFAHKKEAAAFFLHYSYRKIKIPGLTLYNTSGHFLLITGEGNERAQNSLKKAIDYLDSEINLVINLGIAGSFSPEKASIGEIYPIKKILREDEQLKISNENIITENDSGLLCLSSFAPVLSASRGRNLRSVADIVDCESWGLGHVAGSRDLKYYVFKFISDYPGKQSKEEILKNNDLYSQSLYRYYKEKLKNDAKLFTCIVHE